MPCIKIHSYLGIDLAIAPLSFGLGVKIYAKSAKFSTLAIT